MLDRLITPQMSAEVIDHLLQNGWTMRRIARAINAGTDFVERTREEKHCLLATDLQSLATASNTSMHRLLFDAVPRQKLSPEMKKLHDITRELLESSDDFSRAIRRPSRARVRTKAA